MTEPKKYIDAQMTMAARAEVDMVAEGKRLDTQEAEYGNGERWSLPDHAYDNYNRHARICMGHYRLALHAAGLLKDRHLRPFSWSLETED